MGEFGSGRGATVTVGTFDGVHLAHRAVLDETRQRAEAAGRESVVVTFSPHPLEIVRRGDAWTPMCGAAWETSGD